MLVQIILGQALGSKVTHDNTPPVAEASPLTGVCCGNIDSIIHQPSPPPLPIYLLRHSPQAVPFHLSAHQVMTVAHLQPPYHPPANTPSPQVIRGELSRLCSEKAADPDKVLPRLLEACGTELGDPPQHIVILSLLLARVPTRWKTSSLSPVP